MKPDNAFMLELTANMPCKQINISIDTGCRKLQEVHELEYLKGRRVHCWFDEVTWSWFYSEPYIQRYYAGKFVNQIGECDMWIHRFLSGDGDDHLHWHPFNMRSSVLCGWYWEEYLENGVKLSRVIYPGDASRNFLINLCAKAQNCQPLRKIPDRTRRIGMHDIHRIAEVAPDTWTMLLVEPERVPVWGFIDDDGNIETRPTSGRYWWEDFLPRGQNFGDVI